MNASRQKFPSKPRLNKSAARSSLFLVSLLTTTIGFLWITRKKRKQHTQPIDSSHHSELPPTQISLHQSAQTQSSTESPLPAPLKDKQQQTRNSVWTLIGGVVEIVVALALFLIPLALLDIWVINLHANYTYTTPPPRGFEHAVDVPIQSDLSLPCDDSLSTTIGAANVCTTTTTLIATITQIKNVTATESTLTGSLEFIIPHAIQSAICVYAKNTHGNLCHGLGQPAASLVNNSYYYQLKPAYSSLPVTFNISDIMGGVTSSMTIPLEKFFPPNDFDPADSLLSGVPLIVPLTLTVRSEGEQYPDDWYWSTSVISILMPPQLFIDTPPYSKIAGGFLPFDLRVLTTTATDNLSLVFAPKTVSNDENHTLSLFAQHTRGFKELVYLTALLIPFAFLLLLTHTLFSEWKRKKQNELPALLLNVFIAILTVIAIRQVIVPPDLAGLLTRLDYWLLTSAMVLLMLICVRYSAGIAWKYWHIARQLQKPHVTTTSE